MPAPKKPRVPTSQANPDAFFTPAEVAAAAQAKARASVRTPTEVLDAFAPTPLRVGEVVLSPLTLGALMVLERIGSPLADETLTEDTEITAADIMGVIFVLTRPPVDSLALLGEGAAGRAVFDRAVLALASRVELADLPALTLKLRENFTRAFATIVGAGQKKRAPLIPPPATASAGA